MTLSMAVRELQHIPPEFIGKKFLDLLAWQLLKEQTVFYHTGWYLRFILRDWNIEHHSQLQREDAAPRGGMKSLKEILEARNDQKRNPIAG